ncbi:MAG: YneF family protein [Mycoplasma sp.]
MSTGAWIGIIVAAAIVGIIFGVILAYKITKSQFKKHLENNPPITEQQIRSMYAQMGRKPSEAQVRAIMNNFKRKIKE